VLKAIRSFLPLGESETNTLFCRVNDTIHATLYGMLALSALQGVLGGLMFWWLGVPSPWFWALVAAVFAFVPVVDTFVLWLPAAVYLGLEGRWGEALGVAALGSLLVRAIENFLYPVMVKDRLRVPSESIFVALVGGLLLFGVDSCSGRSSLQLRALCWKSVQSDSVNHKLGFGARIAQGLSPLSSSCSGLRRGPASDSAPRRSKEKPGGRS
jgi:hypothetical protein